MPVDGAGQVKGRGSQMALSAVHPWCTLACDFDGRYRHGRHFARRSEYLSQLDFDRVFMDAIVEQPTHHDQYHFILTATRNKSGPLHEFDKWQSDCPVPSPRSPHEPAGSLEQGAAELAAAFFGTALSLLLLP